MTTPSSKTDTTNGHSVRAHCLPSNTTNVEAGRDSSGSAWPSKTQIPSSEGRFHESTHFTHRERRSWSTVTRTMPASDIPEGLATFLMLQIPGPEGEELAEAFRDASDVPPITKQSLSELDIQSIITNIRLRHDVNFDRDLSFRPNLDGAKGQEKVKAAQKYWKALVAELELYNRLFNGSMSYFEGAQPADIFGHVQKRIPQMFRTIQEVLKSLVPDRDHSRVDEHLDVPMMMREIERGVCDLVKRAEWMAHLLKEHCAPMRDEWVDNMVNDTRSGVYRNSSELIVRGLRELVGILEAMKLDVANHQIRNLKTLLIEDTVNFERHYHGGGPRYELPTTKNWYANALQTFSSQCLPQKDLGRFQLEVFVRGVVSTLMCSKDFPESFYLDYDRLASIKAEIHDLVAFEICFDVLSQLLRRLGHNVPVSSTARRDLLKSLTDLLGEGAGHGLQQWIVIHESLSFEIVRAACAITSQSRPYSLNDLNDLINAEKPLKDILSDSFAKHAVILEPILVHQILGCTNLHYHSSPIHLFNNLIPMSSSPIAPTYVNTSVLQPFVQQHTDTFYFNHTVDFDPAKLTDLSNRLSHIILLHWRIWGPVAYVQEGTTSAKPSEDSVSDQSASEPHRSRNSVSNGTPDPRGMAVKMGDLSEPGQEAHIAPQAHSQ